jgi:RNA polymerase sigma-70 factor (ECF subfamily)
MRASTIPVERVLQVNANSIPPDVLLIQQEELARVDRALRALSPELLIIILGFYINGETCENIAAALEIPVGTVYSRLHKARYLVTTHIRENETL